MLLALATIGAIARADELDWADAGELLDNAEFVQSRPSPRNADLRQYRVELALGRDGINPLLSRVLSPRRARLPMVAEPSRSGVDAITASSLLAGYQGQGGPACGHLRLVITVVNL